jgi:hypothetical protein
MKLAGDFGKASDGLGAGDRPTPVRGRRTVAAALARCAVFIGAVAAAAGCSAGDLMVDPGHFSVYHCNDLATQSKTLHKREIELRDLMNRASEGSGGVVIGTLTYRADYESVLTEEKIVRREQAEKKCPADSGSNATSTFTSDQGIR